jgi:hypothetical protein
MAASDLAVVRHRAQAGDRKWPSTPKRIRADRVTAISLTLDYDYRYRTRSGLRTQERSVDAVRVRLAAKYDEFSFAGHHGLRS